MSKTLTQFVAAMLRRAARYKPVQAWLYRLAAFYKQSEIQQVPEVGFEIAEVMPLPARRSEQQDGPRLNLLVPALSQRHVFGGVSTALQVFDALRPYFATVRIIVTDEAAPEPGAASYYSQWPLVALKQELAHESHIVPAGDRWDQTLSVHAQDYFMATAWWTAHNAYALLAWQQKEFAHIEPRRLLYLIQDFEPGFYPWSSRFVLAQATYNQSERTVAVINSHWLSDYLGAQGHSFSSQHVLAPRLHPQLARWREGCSRFEKQRKLLVYGRPGTERNAFSVIVAALRIWAQSYPAASQWQIVSAGEAFASIDLGQSCQLQSLGKLSIEAYAELLSGTAVGLSLMVSPHPSYPPLEMAAFGARVLSNGFANKDLSRVSSYLVSVAHPDPAKLAAALLTLTASFDALDPAARKVERSQIDWQDDFLQTSENSWPWTAQVAAEMLATGA